MSVVAIVQARMGSTRLPGKVLKEVLGKPLLAWQLERLREAHRLGQIVVATSRNPGDDSIEAFCKRQGVDCHRGSELDVLDRYHEAAHLFAADSVVRITADCPLIDPRIIDRLIDMFLDGQYDYAGTDPERSFPLGLDAEVVSIQALETAWREAVDPAEREHVLPFLYRRPQRFRLGYLRRDPPLPTTLRWTVDTVQDFELVKRLLEALAPKHPSFTLEDILQVLQQNPSWSQINVDIRQKSLGE